MASPKKTAAELRKYFSTLGKLGAEARNAAVAGRRPRNLKLDVKAPKAVREQLSQYGEAGGYARAESMTSAQRKKAARVATQARQAQAKANGIKAKRN